ncbi:MAG: hypothetical protein Q8Q81_10855 [Oxalobacteraceae bacterium]|nr:hypothetical protein [Oxalobacteraceae bacterium]
MNNRIFDKTQKGREEIVTRKYRLAQRLRALLVMIDGQHSSADLLEKVSGLGLDEHSIQELHDNGYIHMIDSPK